MFGRQRVRLEDLQERVEAVEARVGELLEDLDGIDLRIQTILRGENGLASADDLTRVTSELEQLRKAVAHGIEDVERRENRIRSTVGRALKVLDEHGLDPSPGLEAEARGLQLWDEAGGGESELQPMREDVGASREALLEQLEGIPGAFGPEDLDTVMRRGERGRTASHRT